MTDKPESWPFAWAGAFYLGEGDHELTVREPQMVALFAAAGAERGAVESLAPFAAVAFAEPAERLRVGAAVRLDGTAAVEIEASGHYVVFAERGGVSWRGPAGVQSPAVMLRFAE